MPFKVGTTSIRDIYVGSTRVVRAYIDGNVVYDKIPVLEYIGAYQLTANASSYSFNIATVGPGLIVGTFGTENGGNVSSVSIGGVSGSFDQSSRSGEVAAVVYAVTTSDTTNITVNLSSSGLRGVLGVYRITNYISATPIFSQGVTGTGTLTSNFVSLPVNAVAIGAYTNGDSGGTSWNEDYTRRYSVTPENNSTMSGATLFTTAAGSYRASVSGVGGDNKALRLVGWR